MAYTKTVWENAPSTATPINAAKMNNIEDGIEALDTAYSGLLNFFYPVGTIYETTSANLDTTTKMGDHFGGTWEVYGAGRVLVAKSADTEFNTIGETGGTKTHTLIVDEMPSHSHTIKDGNNNAPVATVYSPTGGVAISIPSSSGITNGAYIYATNTGGGQAHNNLQPYIVVYRYRRTA